MQYTEAVEDYIKTIFSLGGPEGKVNTGVLAEKLNVQQASVTGMLKKLAALDLVDYQPYYGVSLTASGKDIALEIVRHHRLIETYLAKALGVPWDQLHHEAEKWEHVLSEELEQRMDAMLGYPKYDPHGAPIPTASLDLEERKIHCLWDAEPGTHTVAQVDDEDPALLRYVGELGLYPETEFTLISRNPFDGPLTLELGLGIRTVGQKVAAAIWLYS